MNRARKSQDLKSKNRMPPRNNSFRSFVGKENSQQQKSLSRVENSMKTNKEEILNSISINAAKENKSSLQQKLDILGKILSKGRDTAAAAVTSRKKSENFSNYSSLFYQNTSGHNLSKDGIQKIQKDSSTSLDPVPKKNQPQLRLVNQNSNKTKKSSASPMFVKVNLLLEKNIANKENIVNNLNLNQPKKVN